MHVLLLGLSLGLGAGLSPGPLLALVIRSTVQEGFGAGARVAFSPLITDVPIIVVAAALATTVPETALDVLGIVGGAFIVWLGVDALREPPEPARAAEGGDDVHRSVLWGAVTNALSPHPWVFWITVGAPVLGENSAGDDALFLSAFYLLLIGSKVALAAALAAGRDRLVQGRGYLVLLRLSGLLLLAIGALLVFQGLVPVL